jgi:hypothetical protein
MRVADDLRGAGPVPQSVLDAHRNKQEPQIRLLAIDEEMTAAAKVGDTANVRQLRAETKDLENQQERGRAELRATVKSRRIDPPEKDEGKRLEEQAQATSTPRF